MRIQKIAKVPALSGKMSIIRKTNQEHRERTMVMSIEAYLVAATLPHFF